MPFFAAISSTTQTSSSSPPGFWRARITDRSESRGGRGQFWIASSGIVPPGGRSPGRGRYSPTRAVCSAFMPVLRDELVPDGPVGPRRDRVAVDVLADRGLPAVGAAPAADLVCRLLLLNN